MTKFSFFNPLLLVIIIWMFAQPVFSTHYMGGEITWECTPQGNYRFTMKLYRECYIDAGGGGSAANFGATEYIHTTVPGIISIQMIRVLTRDLSPQCGCPGGVHITCPGMPNGASNMGAVEEHVYTSDAANPNGVSLTGVPPVSGWIFSYASCCRNRSTNIPGQPGWWIRSVMYPYNNTSASTCFDNAPTFAERPATVLCTGVPGSFHQLAIDTDHDSLSFGWAQPCSGMNTPIINYTSGYSYQSPLPNSTHNPNNVPATLSPITGLIQFTSYTAGAFVIGVQVTSYRNGIKTAEVFREVQMVLTNCGSNNPPSLIYTSNLTAVAPGHLHVSVPVGDSVSFGLVFNDTDFCPGTTQLNNIYLNALGDIFGPPLNPTGCNSTPCATLSPSPTPNGPLLMQGSLATYFGWRTAMAHLDTAGGALNSRTYTVIFEYGDDQCPVPQSSTLIVTIEVVAPFSIKASNILCAQIIPNGDVQLTWEPTTMPLYAFDTYEILSATNPLGPFNLVTSIANASANTFTHTGAGANNQPLYYYINTNIHTPIVLSLPSTENIAPIFLTATPQTAATTRVILNWNHTHTSSLSGAPRLYEVYRNEVTTGWQLVGSTYFTGYTDYMPYLNQTVQYRIETALTDPSGTTMLCRSISNVASVFLSAIEESEETFQPPIIFPNPNYGTFLLDPGDLEGEAIVSIIASNGAMVYQSNTTLIPHQPCTIEIPGLAAGSYAVNMVVDQLQYVSTLVIAGSR